MEAKSCSALAMVMVMGSWDLANALKTVAMISYSRTLLALTLTRIRMPRGSSANEATKASIPVMRVSSHPRK